MNPRFAIAAILLIATTALPEDVRLPGTVGPVHTQELGASAKAVLAVRAELDSTLLRITSSSAEDPALKDLLVEGAKRLKRACADAKGSTQADEVVITKNSAFSLGLRAGLGEPTAGMRLNTAAFSANTIPPSSEGLASSLRNDMELARVNCDGLAEGLLAAEPFWGADENLYVAMATIACRVQPQLGERLARRIVASGKAQKTAVLAAEAVLKRRWSMGSKPELKGTTLDGAGVDLTALRGKVVLLSFWATGCTPCVAEFPEIKEAYSDLKDRGFEVIGISLDDDKDTALRLIRRKGIPWPILFDGKGWDGKNALDFGIRWIPQNWVLDRDGKVVGFVEAGSMRESLERVVSANP